MATGNPTIDTILQFVGLFSTLATLIGNLFPGGSKTGEVIRRVGVDLRGRK